MTDFDVVITTIALIFAVAIGVVARKIVKDERKRGSMSTNREGSK